MKRGGVESRPALENLIWFLVSRNEIKPVVLDNGAVMKEAFGYERQRFRVGKSQVDPRGTGSFRDEDKAMVMVELGIEVDGVAVCEASFGAKSRLDLE